MTGVRTSSDTRAAIWTQVPSGASHGYRHGSEAGDGVGLMVCRYADGGARCRPLQHYRPVIGVRANPDPQTALAFAVGVYSCSCRGQLWAHT